MVSAVGQDSGKNPLKSPPANVSHCSIIRRATTVLHIAAEDSFVCCWTKPLLLKLSKSTLFVTSRTRVVVGSKANQQVQIRAAETRTQYREQP